MKTVYCMELEQNVDMEAAPRTRCIFDNCKYWNQCAGPVKEQEAKEKKAKWIAAFENSVNVAKTIDLDDLHKLCRKIDTEIMNAVEEYKPGLLVDALPEEGQSFVVYCFNGENVFKIGYTKHPMNYVETVAREFNGKKLKLGFGTIQDELISQVIPTLMIKNVIPVKNTVGPTNPVYITDGQLRRAAREVYGIGVWGLKKVFANHLEITEIRSGDTMVYLKAEMDFIIRNDYRS